MIELCVPEVRAVQIERLLVVRQEIPGVSRQIDIHAFLGNDPFGRIDAERAVLLVADALDPAEVGVKVAGQEAVQGVDALIQEDDIYAPKS